MEKENNIIQYSFRLNLNYPEHLMIHKALMNLDENLYRSKSTFIIDALDKYVKGVSPEVLIEALSDRNYITRAEFEEMQDQMKEQIIKLVTKSVVREVTKNMSSLFAAAFSDDDPVINIDCSQD